MLTDATLCYIENASKQQQQLILRALGKLPIEAIEITAPVWENIADMKNLPQKKYILRINNYKAIRHYKGFYRYVVTAQEPAAEGQLAEQPMYASTGVKCSVRVVGLSRKTVPDMEKTFSQWRKAKRDISFEPLNSLDQGTALAFAWHNYGGQSVSTFCGIANHAPLEEILLTDYLAGNMAAIKGFNFTILKKTLEAITDTSIPANKPILGNAIFAVESGIHVDGIMKDPQLYEPYPPELIHAKRHIVLGCTSGRKSIEAKLRELKLNCCKIDTAFILDKVKEKSRSLCRSITDKEFYDLVEMMGRV